jgi:hypothetical protein
MKRYEQLEGIEDENDKCIRLDAAPADNGFMGFGKDRRGIRGTLQCLI